jgi:hypothetical protein
LAGLEVERDQNPSNYSKENHRNSIGHSQILNIIGPEMVDM